MPVIGMKGTGGTAAPATDGLRPLAKPGTSALIRNELATQARRPGSAVVHLILLGCDLRPVGFRYGYRAGGVNVYRLGSPPR
jgi:hypothetical protein